MDKSCCRGSTKCDDENVKNVCAYYKDRPPGGKVHLGGIYEQPHSDKNPSIWAETWEGHSDTDDEQQKQIQEERRLQCQAAMKKWSFDFLKKIPHPLAPCSDSQAQVAKKRFQDMERVQTATENIVEKFGGLTLGFSGPLPPPQVIQYHGLKVVPRRFPDYPQELTMKGVRRPRISQITRRRRSWEDEEGAEPMDFPVQATFSPPTASTVPSVSQMQKQGPNLLFVAGQNALQGKSTRPGTGGSSAGRRLFKTSQMPPSADELMLEYVDKCNLEMMFEYFLALACLYTPDNPFQFISDLAGKMVKARTDDAEFQSLERIFTREHVAALFRLFDKEQNGYITHRQYKTGMETLGLIAYTKDPDGSDQDKILENVFVDEA